MNINDKNNDANIEKPLDSIRKQDEYTKKEKSPSKIKALAQPIFTNASREPIISRLKELLAAADKIAPNKNLQTTKTALSALEKSKEALNSALGEDIDISDRLSDIARDKLPSAPSQQCRELRDMELYLTLLNSHANTSNLLTDDEKLQLSSLVKEVREAINRFSEATAPKWTSHLDKLDALIRDAVPKNKTLPDVPSILNSHQGTEIDSKTFASILLESMISGSKGLEGNTEYVVVSYLKSFLEANKDRYSGMETFPAVLKMATDADTHLKAYKNEFYMGSVRPIPMREAFHKSLTHLVTELKPGEKTLIPIGWAGTKSGHAMQMGIEREKDGTLRVVIYNTGAGLNDYHPTLFENGEAFYQPFVAVSGVQEERLLDEEFSQALVEMLRFSKNPSKAGGDTNYGPKDIYGIILNGLEGKIEPCLGEREKFILPQFSGICTWASQLAVLHTNLPPQDYYAIVSDIALDSLCSYYQSVKGQLGTNEEFRQMLQHAAVACTQIAMEGFQNKGISFERLQAINATLNELQTVLEAAEGQSRHDKISEELLAFEKLERVNPAYQTVRPWTTEKAGEVKSSSLPSVKGSPTPPPFSFDWIHDPNQIEQGLNRLITGYRSGTAGIRDIESFFRLQAHEKMEEVWSKIPEEQLTAVTVQLADLGELLFHAGNAFPQNIREYTTYAYLISALSLLLSRRNPEIQKYVEENGIPLGVYDMRVTSTSIYSNTSLTEDQNLFGSEDRQLRKKALDILNAQSNQKSHFSVYNYANDPTTLEGYSAEKPYSNAEMRYISELLDKDPALIAKLEEQYPGHTKLKTDRDWQVALALCDWYGAVLPPAFCALRRIDLIGDLLLRGKITAAKEKSVFETQIIEKNQSLAIQFVNKPEDLKKPTDYISDNLFKQLVKIREKQNEYTKDYEQIFDGEKDVMLRCLDDWENNLQLILTQGDWNGDKHFIEQQVIKTIAYFSDHPDKLADHDMRMLCRFLLFEEDHLEKILEKNPAAHKLLTQFVQNGYHYFIERKNISAATFFIEIGRDLEGIFQSNKIDAIFPDIRKLCLELLSQGELSNQERSIIYQQIAASYTSHPPADFTAEDARLLLTASLHDEVFPPRNHNETMHLRDQMQRARSKHAEDLEKQLKGPNGSNICHAILCTFEPSAVPQPWDCESKYPLCISQDGSYVINVKNLMIHIKDSPIACLPRSILNLEEFKQLFSRNDYTARRIDGDKYSDSYEFTDERGVLTQIHFRGYSDERGTTISQKLEDGHWYELTTPWKLRLDLPKDFEKICNKSTLWVPLDPEAPKQIIVKDKSHHVTHSIPLTKGVLPPVVPDQEQKELHEFLTGKKKYGAAEELVRKKILTELKTFSCVFGHLSEEERSEIANEIARIKSRATEELYMAFDRTAEQNTEIDNANEAMLNKFMGNPPANRLMDILQQLLPACQYFGQLVIASCQKENGTDSPWYLTDIKYGPNLPVKKLFKDGMLWKDKQGELKELELPSLGLRFDMKLEDKVWNAYSVEHPGYFVSPNQRYRGLQPIPGAIVLENSAGKRKLILPYGKIAPEAAGSFSTLLDIRVDAETATPSISYDLDSASKPAANNKEQKLYLANILLMEKKYEQAQALLRASFSNVVPYSDKERLLLDQLSKIPYAARDNSPHATAVAFTALALLRHLPETSRENSFAPKEILHKLAEGYLGYKNQTGVIPHLKMTHDEEKAALNCLINGLTSLMKTAGVKREADPETLGLLLQLYFFLGLLESQDYNYAREPILKKSESKITTSATLLSMKLEAKYHEQTLLTRPQSKFLSDFYKHYALALEDPVKLEITISAAAQDAKYIPADIITLLRSVAYCTANKISHQSNFPPSSKEIEDVIFKKNDKRFSEIMKQAQEVEEIMMEEKAAAQKPIAMTGKPLTYARQQEAQQVEQRPDMPPAIKLAKMPPRSQLLKSEDFFEAIPNHGLQFSPEEIFGLQLAIKGRGNETSAEAQERSNKISSYWSSPDHKAAWHALKPEKLQKAKTLLQVEQAEMGKRLNRLEQELLNFANNLPEDAQEALLFEMEKMGNLRQPISLRDIIIFTARHRHFSLAGKNPQLAAYEKELLEKSIRFFDAKAQQQQLGRAIASIKALEEFLVSIENTEKISPESRDNYARLSEVCYKELNRQPPYNAHKYPELLMFEVLEEIGLHDWQVKDLERMLRPKTGEKPNTIRENPNIILEKVMGSGKTKVYLPLLALSKADGKFIPFIVVHSSQYNTVAQAMQINSGQNFSQVAHALEFSRDSDTSLEALQKIRDELLLVQKQRHFFVVTDKSMHSLSLAFTQLWDTYLAQENEDPALAVRIEVFREIMNTMQTKGKAILDEADLLLNVRYEVVYSLGDPKPIKAAHSDLVADLYRSIAPQIEALTPFTQSDYLAKKPEMIRSFINQVVASDMPKCDQKKIFDYLIGGKEGADYVDTLPEAQRDLLAIAFYEFDQLLPIVLERRCNEHYGYSANPNKILPVPYVASGVPSATSEFSFPYALLDYAIQTLKNDGVTSTLLKRLVQGMQNRAAKEQKADPTLALQDTQAYQAFYELCGKDSPSKVSIPFLKVNDSDIAKLVKMYKENPPDIYEFAKKYVNHAVSIHPRKLVSTPFTLDNMFYERQGFTGTPFNYKTFSKKLETIRDPNSAGKTEGIIWKNSQTGHSLSSNEFKEMLEEIKEIQKDGTYRAFIDVGAIFNGHDNQTVAESLLRDLPTSIKGVLFYKDNRACVLERGKKDPVPFPQGASTENLYIFYDQWHTTGTDFRIHGKSLISIGKNTKMRDLEQGYMRDRQAAQGKRVELLVAKEASDYIKKELKLPKDKIVETADILRSNQINQDRELDDQLMMASFGRIKEALNNHLQSVLRDPKIPPHKIHEKAKAIHALIGDDVKDSPYEDFGRYKNELDAKVFFSNVINQSVGIMAPLLTDKELCPAGLTAESLKKELEECIDFDLLPAKISSAANNQANQLAENQNQQENQQERMAMVNKELMTDIEPQNKNSPAHWNFDASQKTYSASFYRVIDPADLSKETLPVMGENWMPQSEGQAPFMSLSAIFAADESLRDFSDVFDIEASYNFLPLKGNARENNDTIPVQTAPFQQGHLMVKNILICKDNRTGDVQVRLLSQGDTGFFFNQLADRPATEKEREVDATLYHLSLKVYQSNNEAVAAGKENIIAGPVLRKIVQAKFFNGESIYTQEERVHLAAWIKEKGRERMERLFMEHILPAQKDDKQQEYPGSVLSKLLSA